MIGGALRFIFVSPPDDGLTGGTGILNRRAACSFGLCCQCCIAGFLIVLEHQSQGELYLPWGSRTYRAGIDRTENLPKRGWS